MNPLGINLSFAVKRWPEPEVWAELVARNELSLVQFSFDLLDPWWPDEAARPLARRVRKAAEAHGLTLHSAFAGLAAYTYNGLLHPEAEGRRAAVRWYERAIDLAAEMGVRAVGGPLGGLSVRQAAEPGLAQQRYEEVLETLHHLTEYAAAQGLSGFLIEPTPLPREVPWTVAGARRLLEDLGETALPVSYTLDLGHALYAPLYGGEAGLDPWLSGLAGHIGLIHLQQTDGQSDSHWGFAREGLVDPAEVVGQLQGYGLAQVPVILELFYPFEAADDDVLKDVTESVRYCREKLQ